MEVSALHEVARYDGPAHPTRPTRPDPVSARASAMGRVAVAPRCPVGRLHGPFYDPLSPASNLGCMLMLVMMMMMMMTVIVMTLIS